MTKEEKIKEAYGEYWDLVKNHIDDNGWFSNDREDFYLSFGDCEKLGGTDYGHNEFIRPKSLQGIEDYYTFKDVVDFENYKVNKQGVLISKSRVSIQKNGKSYHVKERIMKPQIDNTGYIVFCLRNDKKESKKVYLHRILCELFLENPENKPCVNHKDGVKYNNSLSNLEWCSYKENNIHAFDNGLQKSGKEHHFYGKEGKFCHNSKKIICNDSGKVFDSLTEASLFFNISKSHLSNILKGIRKSTINISHYQPIEIPKKLPIY